MGFWSWICYPSSFNQLKKQIICLATCVLACQSITSHAGDGAAIGELLPETNEEAWRHVASFLRIVEFAEKSPSSSEYQRTRGSHIIWWPSVAGITKHVCDIVWLRVQEWGIPTKSYWPQLLIYPLGYMIKRWFWESHIVCRANFSCNTLSHILWRKSLLIRFTAASTVLLQLAQEPTVWPFAMSLHAVLITLERLLKL